MEYKYFSVEELMCKCGCGTMEMNEEFMSKLIAIREKAGFKFKVTSAYRCPEHNNAVSITGFNGPHTTGRAIDIATNSTQKFAIMVLAQRAGFKRFGIARSFIHIDNLGGLDGFPESVLWTY